MLRRGAWLAVPVVLLAACSGPAEPAAQSPTPSLTPSVVVTPSAVPTPSTTTTATVEPEPSETPRATASSQACTRFGTTADISSSDPQAMTTMTGKSMRVGRHDCFERFVFELQGEGDRPGWTVGYRTPLAGQASGERIPLKGAANLEILLGAWTVNDFEGRPDGWPPFTGAAAIVTKGFVAIKEARNLYAYEGTTQLGLGIDRKRPFKVVLLSNPTRLVVDVYTGIPAS